MYEVKNSTALERIKEIDATLRNGNEDEIARFQHNFHHVKIDEGIKLLGQQVDEIKDDLIQNYASYLENDFDKLVEALDLAKEEDDAEINTINNFLTNLTANITS